MTSDIIGSPGQCLLFGGLLVALIGVGLICFAGEGALYALSRVGAALVLTGSLMWLHGAITRQGELLNEHV